MNKSNDFEVTKIPIAELVPFKNHIFKPYDDKRMNTLLASVKENGIIHPIVVRKITGKDSKEKFEIISGHNRVKAAKLAGQTEVPAVVKELSDDEAVILSNEANIESRNFSTWLPSEKIKSINQYHSAVKNQGNKKNSKTTSGDNRQKSDDDYARQKTAAAYGQSNSTIRVYIKLYELIEPLLDKLDMEDFGTTPAYEIAFISPEGQSLVSSVLDEDKKMYKITVKRSERLRAFFENEIDDSMIKNDSESVKTKIREILIQSKIDNTNDGLAKDIIYIPMSKEKYIEFFPDDKHQEDVVDYIIKALDRYKSQEDANNGEI